MKTDFRSAFREEALDLVNGLEDLLLDLEKDPDSGELVDRVFRSLHTIKGSGAMFGFDEVVAFVHEIETVFDLVRNCKLPVSKDLITLTLESRDQIKNLITLETSGVPADMTRITDLMEAFREIARSRIPDSGPESGSSSGSSGSRSDSRQEPSGEPTTWRICFHPHPQIFHAGHNPIGILKELSTLGEMVLAVSDADVPPLESLDPESFRLSWEILLKTTADRHQMLDPFLFIEDQCDLTVEPFAPETSADPPSNTVAAAIEPPTPVAETDAAVTTAADEQERVSPPLAPKTIEPAQAGIIDSRGKGSPEILNNGGFEGEKPEAGMVSGEETGKVDVLKVGSDKLDHLVNLIGELVTVQARLSQTASGRNDPGLMSISEELERLTNDLRDSALKIRMLPVGTILERFPRLVRDLAEALGKDIRLTLEGTETELDKTVIERIGEPLIHLVRNAVDHGIELPDARELKGKPRQGAILISANHFGGNFCIRVIDDGAGLDLEAIKARAVEAGLCPPEAHPTMKEILKFLCHPGFSTREKADSLSGRGVGMNVVKKVIDGLRGTLEVETQAGEKTVFSIQLPLTLAIIEGLLVSISDRLFVIPLTVVEECIELTSKDEKKTYRKNVTIVREHFVPYIPLREKFVIPGESPAIQQIVITKVDQHRVGFVVDRVVGEIQTVIKPLGSLYKNIGGISGATILGDGTVALIIDLHRIVQEENVESLIEKGF